VLVIEEETTTQLNDLPFDDPEEVIKKKPETKSVDSIDKLKDELDDLFPQE